MTRFESTIKNCRDDLQQLNNMPKKKRMKNLNKIKGLQSQIQYLEEHEGLLEQLVKNKEFIDVEKIESI